MSLRKAVLAASLSILIELLCASPMFAGIDTVTTVSDGGNGSFRQAMLDANSHFGKDTIRFNISGNSLHSIQPLTEFPTITDSIFIDGYSQPGSSPNSLATGTNAVLLIELDGSSIASAIPGLKITAGRSTVRGLVVNRFGDAGISLLSNNNIVEGNFVGTDATGLQRLGNGVDGIFVGNGLGLGSNNLIGGTAPSSRNVISGNGRNGITLDQVQRANIVGNYIGTNAAGNSRLYNRGSGIGVFIGGQNIIGGGTTGHRNVISGNVGHGIELNGSVADTVQGNYIGTDATGVDSLSNGGSGINIFGFGSMNHLIGGSVAARNVISANKNDGIRVSQGSNMVVASNYIGTNATGNGARANGNNGIYIGNGELTSSENTIGGSTVGERNIISGNSGSGVKLVHANSTLISGNYIGTDATGSADIGNAADGITVGSHSDSNTVQNNLVSGNGLAGIAIGRTASAADVNVVIGNYVGTNAAGTAAIPNDFEGVLMNDGSSGNRIGGTIQVDRNIISGNNGAGIGIVNATSNTVEGNYIGTDVSGNLPLGNIGAGIATDLTEISPDHNTIRGSSPGSGNILSGNSIAFNQIGVRIDAGISNSILGNSIFDNKGLGIDLGGDGVTANHYPPAVFGPNHFQNFPVLAFAAIDLQAVQGYLKALPNTIYRIEFFSSPSVDNSGYGEGKTFVGSSSSTTDDSGYVVFYASLPGHIVNGQYISATATDPSGNTSEFSGSISVSSKVKVFGDHYVVNTTLSGIPLHWADGSTKYRMHTSVPLAFRGAMEAGFNSWSNLDQIQYLNGGVTDTSTWGGTPDGLNNNVWVTSGWTTLTEADSNTIAVTRVRYNSLTGEIFDADIAYDAQHFSWTVVGGPNTTDMDVENVTAHEAGHFSGLGDIFNPGNPGYIPLMGSGNENVTMFGLIRRGETSKRLLDTPDTAGIGYIYSHLPQYRIDMMLVFDGSAGFTSTYNAFEPSKSAAAELVQRMRNGDRIGVIKLPNTVILPLTNLQDQTSRANAIAAINSLTSGGPSAIGSGLQEAQNQLNIATVQTNNAKTMILFSAGEENAAPPALSVLSSLLATHTHVFTLGFAGSGGQALTNKIADTTGGSYYRSTGPTINQVVPQIWNKLVGQQLIYKAVASSDTFANVPLPGLAWQGPIGPGNAVVFPGVAWQGPVGGGSRLLSSTGSFVLSLKAPGSSIIIDSAYVAQHPELGIQYFSGATYSFYIITNPTPGVWTLYVYAQNQPSQPAPVVISIAALSDITMDFNFDKASYAIGEQMVMEAKLAAGGSTGGDPHVTGGGPITDANVIVEMLLPGSSSPQSLPLPHIGNGVYRATFSNTTLPGTYAATFRATKDTIELTGQLSAFVVPVAPVGIHSDDFNTATLKPFWTFVNPGNPSAMSLVGTGTIDARLRIQIPDGASHDVWTAGNMAPRVMQSCNDIDFEVEVKFDGAMTSQYQIEGIIVEQDANRFLRFDFVKGNANMRIFAASFTGTTPTVLRDINIPQGNPAWMRLKRQGNNWIQSYSYDGNTFIVLNTITSVALNVSKIGPFVGNAGYPEGTAPAFNGLIDYFFNTASPIVPEDGTTAPPSITQQPVNMTVPSGQTASFMVAATGTTPLLYQWQKNNANIVSATNPNYTTPPTTAGDNGSAFQCVVSNSSGTVTSNAAILTVTSSGGNSGIVSDDFNTASLKPFWTFINPAPTSTLSMVGTGTVDARASLAVPSGASHDVWTGANNAPRLMQPMNNTDFEVEAKFEQPMNAGYQLEGIIVEQSPGNYLRFGFVHDFSNTRLFAASFTANNPSVKHDIDITGNVGARPLGGGTNDVASPSTTKIRNPSQQQDDVSDESSPKITPTIKGDGGGVGSLSMVSVVYLRVKRVGNAWTESYSTDGVNFTEAPAFTHVLTATRVGPYVGNAGSTPGNAPAFTGLVDYFFNNASRIDPEDGTPSPPVITENPTDKTVGVGQSATFAVGATGSAPLSFKWQKNTVDIPGATNPSYTTPSTSLGDDGTQFRCIVSNPLGTATSSSATLHVTTVPNPSGIFSDDFYSSTLRPQWETANPAPVSTFSLVGSNTVNARLSIAVPGGPPHDIWYGGNNAPRLMQPSNNTDFEVEAKFEQPMTSGYQMQGILAQETLTNFIRFGFVKDPGTLRVFAASFVGGAPTTRSDVNITNGNPLWLRVKREGNVWTQSYSLNGSAFMSVGPFTHALTVAKVGVYAGNASPTNTPAPAFTSLVDYFFNTSFPIVPEDGGVTGPIAGGLMSMNGSPIEAILKPLPTEFSLEKNYPNPFNPTTTISYGIPEPSAVTLNVYNTLGQEIISLADGACAPGNYQVTWDGKNSTGNTVGSGVYLYRFTATKADGKFFSALGKMVLMK